MVTVSHTTQVSNGPRAMNPFRDWHGVAQLMRVAFQSEVGLSSLPLLPDWPWLNWIDGVLLGAAATLGGDAADHMLGYIWKEDGHIVGNATISLVGGQKRVWLLSNVAVHPSHRRRGIARALVELAMQMARQHGGTYLALQVERENFGARQLYEQIGFHWLEQVCEYGNAVLPPLREPLHDLTLTTPTREQWAQARALATTPLPTALHHYRFAHAAWFDVPPRVSWWTALMNFLDGTQTTAQVVCEERTHSVVGGLVVRAQMGWGAQRIGVVLADAYRGQVEDALLACLAHELNRYATRRATFYISSSHTALAERLRAHGLHETRALDFMALPLQ
jgi:ribosomal protein S18 acetylase RimI-like enzyme